MHDLKNIRENPENFDAALARRGAAAVAVSVVSLDEKRRAIQTELQMAQARRNEASKAIGAAMGQGDAAKAEALKAEVGALKDRMSELDEQERMVGAELDAILAAIPNLPLDDVPQGADENDNVEISRWGDIRAFDFTPRDHADIGPALGLDFETGVLISGSRFTFMRGQMARLNRALGQFMLDHQTSVNGYIECATPYLVRDEALFGTGQLPKFAEDSFQTTDGRWLIPTAEVSLTNSVREQILDEKSLPIRITALTPCFRSEAGAAGKDTKGLIRQHQFEKVELVSIVAARKIAPPNMSAWWTQQNRCCGRLAYPIAGCCFVPVTWATAPAKLTIWKSGCRGRGFTAKLAAVRNAAIGRHAG